MTRGELRHPELAIVDLVGRTPREVRPIGKHLLIRFDREETLHCHLRMDGAWHLYTPGARWRRPAHQVRVLLGTEDRIAVGFNLHDLRLIPTAEEDLLVGHLGPDPLAPEWDSAHAEEAVRRLTATPSRAVGEALLDQRVLAGVGNLYMTEVCFLLGCSPATPVRAIDPVRAVRLCRELLNRNAWHPEQTTTGDPRRGATHWVYGRRNCLRCGHAVHRDSRPSVAGERVGYQCPHCQPLLSG